jgi:hypothetical protein
MLIARLFVGVILILAVVISMFYSWIAVLIFLTLEIVVLNHMQRGECPQCGEGKHMIPVTSPLAMQAMERNTREFANETIKTGAS